MKTVLLVIESEEFAQLVRKIFSTTTQFSSAMTPIQLYT